MKDLKAGINIMDDKSTGHCPESREKASI